MTAATLDLVDLFDLAADGPDTWMGRTDGLRLPQLFGGQLVGQSIVAAGRTVTGATVHSSHTTFLRGGSTGRPVTFAVERLRDGRTISTREVSARQDDRLLCRTIVSFATDRVGLSHARPAPSTPGPMDCPSLEEVAEADGGLGEFWEDFAAIDVRVAPDVEGTVPHSASPPNGIWMRTSTPLPDDPLLHAAAVAYASDLMLMSTAVTPHGHTTGHERSLAARWDAVSLDHTLWFRRTPRADDWLLFEHTTPMAGAGRALVEAGVFDLDGDPVCHVAQEALLRDHPDHHTR